MRKFLINLCVLTIICNSAQSQILPDNNRYIPKTPEASRYEQMGNIANNPSTGLPSISIPIYTINLKDFNWNISLGYNAKGFKVDDVASNVGLGWNLAVTGLISQSVNGASDVLYPLEVADNVLKRHLNLGGYNIGPAVYYTHEQDVYKANQSIEGVGMNLQPDLFSMNIGSMNYKFFLKDELDANNQPVTNGYTMPASNVKIKFQRFISTHVDSAKFEITDERGNIFYLKNRGTNRNFNYCAAQKLKHQDYNFVFYLDKIRTVNGEEIRFAYNHPVQYSYEKSKSETYVYKADEYAPCSSYPSPSPGLCWPVFLADEALVDSIWVSNGVGIKVVYGNRLDLTNRQGGNINSAVNKIKIYDQQFLLKSVVFDQSYYNSGGNTVNDKRLRLDKLQILDALENSANPSEYLFQYNTTTLPNRLSLSQDSLGYYNMQPNSTLIPRFSNRSRSLEGTKAGVLERIYYPFKGYTSFAYGLSTLPDGGLSLTRVEDFDGLQVSRTRSYAYLYPKGKSLSEVWETIEPVYFKYKDPYGNDAIGVCLVQTEYSQSRDQNIDTQMDKPDPYFGEIHEFDGVDGINGKSIFKYNWKQTSGISLLPVELTEKIVYANLNGVYLPLKKEEYEYTARDVLPGDGIFYEPVGIKEKRAFGKQISRTNEEISDLRDNNGGPIQNALAASYSQLSYMFRSIPYYQTKVKTSEYNLSDGTILVAQRDSFFDNDWHGMPTRIIRQGSDGTTLTKATTYPMDYAVGTSFIDGMVSKNLIAYPIETVDYQVKGSNEFVLNGVVNTYKDGGRNLLDKVYQLKLDAPIAVANYKFSNGNFGQTLPQSSYQNFLPDTRYEQRISYDIYDSRGNPLQYTIPNGISNSFIWGYKSRYLIAEVKNASYTSIESILGGSGVLNSFQETTPNKSTVDAFLAPLFTSLPNAQISSFVYHPKDGLTSRTDAKGMTSYYEYDSFQRLKHIKDQNGDIIKSYCYNYAGQLSDCNAGGNAGNTANWVNTGMNSECETQPDPFYHNQAAFTGNLLIEQVDNNPNSATYNTIRKIVDTSAPQSSCPPNYYFTAETDPYLSSVSFNAKRSYDDGTTKTMRFRVRYDSISNPWSISEQYVDIQISSAEGGTGYNYIIVDAASYLEVELMQVF